ncbi:MAG: hypothetical protein AUJ07_04500 [Crenarchaeota archaeon 13_1_40CM_3_53_5]|nr:MAG: hypothetical protein AUJ07_04500 [Crenarchaeota archaeon 13_1_40CM_3_53_5]
MRLPRDSSLARRLVEAGVICGVGLSIAVVIGFVQDPTPFGDDSIYYVGAIKSLGSNYPFLGWDPHVFAGYIPTIGLSWLTYLVPFLLVRAGYDVISSFHLAFVFVFLLFGLAVFYFARSVGSDRTVSFSMSILAWSTNAYWNNAIWGGAYNRAFTIPFMILAMGATYRYASSLDRDRLLVRGYWICLVAWTLTYLGDVFLAITGTAIGSIFLLFSAGTMNIVSGLKRVGLVFLPAVGLTLWQWVPILLQDLTVGPYRNQYVGPVDWTSLFLPGSTWQSTLNLVYIPLILSLCVILLLTRSQTSLTEKAFLVALSAVGTYWFVMGWVMPLWPYLPRLMASNSSVENLAWIFLMTLSVLFAVFRRNLMISVRPVFRLGFRVRFSLDGKRLVNILRTTTLLIIVVNALIIVPGIKPVNWGPLTSQLNTGVNAVLGPPSSDYRISLQDRALTRGFYFYQPDRFDTGGRVVNLDPNPFFNNWYDTDVFYKNDLSSINTNYDEDRPAANVSSLLESPYNFAGVKFWFDWYGVDGAVFYPYSYLYNTIGNYSVRSSLFSVAERSTTYSIPEVFVTTESPSPILVATNATTVGLYSTSSNSEYEYRSLISILTTMGLNSRFVVPLYLHSIQDALTIPVDLVVTDSDTYSTKTPEMQALLKTSSLVVVSSEDGPLGSAASIQFQGTHLLVEIPLSFSQLVSQRESGGYYFISSAPIVGLDSFNASASSYYAAATSAIRPNTWNPTFTTSNVQGTLQIDSNSVSLNLTSTDTTRRSQFNIDSLLQNLAPLSNGLKVSLLVQTTANISLGVSFTSNGGCCSNYVAVDEEIRSGDPVQIQIPYSDFRKWGNSSDMFGVSRDLGLAVNLPLGEASAVVRISNVSLVIPAYTISDLPRAISLSHDGVLLFNTLGSNGVGLMNNYNASTTILNLSVSTQKSITTIASLSGGESNARYDKIIIAGGIGQPTPMVVLFAQSPWSPVHETWSNNENMISSSVPEEFRGVIWKETYSSQWRFEFGSGAAVSPVLYYYAGPGMIYIPLANSTGQLVASFTSTTPTSVAVLSISIATIAPLVVLRNKLPRLGLRRGSSGRT